MEINLNRHVLILSLVGTILAVGIGLGPRPALAQVSYPSPSQPLLQAVPGGPYLGVVGTPVAFNGAARSVWSLAVTQYRWSFGDGAVGFGQTTLHTFPQSGTFVVSLTVVDVPGDAETEVTTVTIQPAAPTFQLSAGGPYSGTVGAAVTFNGIVSGLQFSGPVQFGWNFGDGAIAYGQTVMHAYAFAGTFIVALTATSSIGQSASAQTTATISQPLQVSAGAPTSGIAGRPVFLGAMVSGAAAPSFSWGFGDGSSGNGQTAAHVYANPGTYTATVYVVDLTSNQQASSSISVVINSPLAVDANGPYFGVVGQPLQMAATVFEVANPQFHWDFGDGGMDSGPSPIHVY